MSMKWMACVGILVSAPAFAQSGAGTFSLDRASLTSVHQYVAAEAVPAHLSLPSNLLVASAYRPIVEAMLHRSPTFRRQVVRIAGAPHLTAHLKLVPPDGSTARATTQVTRYRDGRLIAVIDIFPLNDNVELIAHEVEHVIEQLDEVDLESLAARPGTGVYLNAGSHAFETTRAIRVGLKVTDEVR